MNLTLLETTVLDGNLNVLYNLLRKDLELGVWVNYPSSSYLENLGKETLYEERRKLPTVNRS